MTNIFSPEEFVDGLTGWPDPRVRECAVSYVKERDKDIRNGAVDEERKRVEKILKEKMKLVYKAAKLRR